MKDKSKQMALPSARFALGGTLVIMLALLLFTWMMRPSITDFGLMAGFLTITAVVSLVAGYGIYRFGWMNQAPRLQIALLAGYAVSSLLTFLNVWLTARLMFASQHDLLLATVLLIFAGGIAMILGVFFTETITQRIQYLNQAASLIAAGNFDTRVPENGRDEMAQLAVRFNSMAAQLQTADEKQRELETLRRDLVAWVSHDLQTPLASIRAIVEALADGLVEDPATRQRYLNTARKDIQSLSLLIDDLFQMAQLDAGGIQLDIEDSSLSDLVSDTLESFSEPARSANIRLEGKVAAGIDPVCMDSRRIGRVLTNLISNALRYSDAGGSILIQVTRDSDTVRVEVADTGSGIPHEDLPMIFERFYRGEKSRSRASGGAGLGLAIARGIVTAHGGEIGVASQPGKGTTFHFTLPVKH